MLQYESLAMIAWALTFSIPISTPPVFCSVCPARACNGTATESPEEGSGRGGSGEDYDPLKSIVETPARAFDTSFTDPTRSREIFVKAVFRDADHPQPVILFSHGLGGSRHGGTYLSRHWSARGYIVIMMQHPGSDESIWKDLPRREWLPGLKKAANSANTLDRFRDVAAVIDELERWNRDPNHSLHGRLDLEHLGMSGHSYGAITTQGVSGQSAPGLGQRFTDKRIDAAVLLSPNRPRRIDPTEAFSNVSIPWLLMTGTRDTSPVSETTVDDRREVFPALPPSIDRYELVLHEAHHSAFSDRQLRPQEKRNPNHHRVILATSTAFWDTYLRGTDAARKWLQGDSPRKIMEPEDDWQQKLGTDDDLAGGSDLPK